MNILSALAAAAPRVERAVERTVERAVERAIKRSARAKSDRRPETTAGTDKRSVSRADFAAYLALISGADSRVRADRLPQLPAEGGSIVDKLLDDDAGELIRSATRGALDALLSQANTPADTASPINDLEAVTPELRARVQRVIERMKSEYGHEVTVVESARSQARQDFLFEQGRTRPGQVVTWTRDSAHTRGEAVDVVVDGSWDNAAGFARLQRIANEEGLHTLGMKDPGHLEWVGHGARAAEHAAPAASDTLTAAVQRQGASASVAQVAGVAQVARVADTNHAAAPTLGDDAAAYLAQSTVTPGGSSESQGNAFGRGERDEPGKQLYNGRTLGLNPHRASGETTSYVGTQGAASGAPALTGAERTTTGGGAAGSEQAQRVSDIQAMRADAPAGPLSRMTLNVENANGTQDRITVNLRGKMVDTFIATDASSAERMKLRTGELHESMIRHGLDADSVRISGTAPTMSGDDAQGQSTRERAAERAWDKQQETRREQQEQADREQQRQQASQRDWQALFNGTQK